MRVLSQGWVVLGAMVGTSATLLIAAPGCGGDDSGTGDASADHTSDGTTSDHTGHDSPTDASADRVGSDATDGGLEGNSDSGDSGPGFDAEALYAFPGAVNAAYCQRLAFCCDGADSGAFQLNACISALAPSGWLGVSLASVHDGHLDFDSTQAGKCLSDIAAIDCMTVTSTSIEAQIASCGEAMVGKLSIGTAGCTSSWDCTPPSYCDNAGTDAGSGTCQALKTVGTKCRDLKYSTDCSELGLGHPEDYCGPSDGGDTCQAELVNGTPCYGNFQCESQICDFATSECQPSTVFSDPGVPFGLCAFFNTSPDAGDGG
jgi:hypothetical protein